jgi:hypothetical protein
MCPVPAVVEVVEEEEAAVEEASGAALEVALRRPRPEE